MKRVNMSNEAQQGVDVNMSPLIDCVFLLLIFFIVTTVFVEETGVTVDKPKAASAKQLDKNSIMIALTHDGNVVFGGREIGVSGVRGIVKQQLKTREAPVIIMADSSAETARLVDIIDECKLAGAKTVNLATRLE